MKKKYLIFCATFLMSVTAGMSQDTSKLSTEKLKNNSNTSSGAVYPDSGAVNKKGRRGATHTSVNPNSGTSIPNTTSGTLNSTVNPNTQLVIPIRKKKKSNYNFAPDSGISAPRK